MTPRAHPAHLLDPDQLAFLENVAALLGINSGQTWVELPPTLDVHITVTGLPVGTNVLFRWRTLLNGVYGDWSPSVPYPVT